MGNTKHICTTQRLPRRKTKRTLEERQRNPKNNTAETYDTLVCRHKWETGRSERTRGNKHKNNRATQKTQYAEKGNVASASRICAQQHEIPMNTWKRAPLTKEEKNKLRNSQNQKIPENKYN